MKVRVEVIQQKRCTFIAEAYDVQDGISFIEVQKLIGEIPFDELPNEFPDAAVTTSCSRAYEVVLEETPWTDPWMARYDKTLAQEKPYD